MKAQEMKTVAGAVNSRRRRPDVVCVESVARGENVVGTVPAIVLWAFGQGCRFLKGHLYCWVEGTGFWCRVGSI